MITYRLNNIFERDGVWWRVSSIGPHVVVATRCGLEGEPSTCRDIIVVTT